MDHKIRYNLRTLHHCSMKIKQKLVPEIRAWFNQDQGCFKCQCTKAKYDNLNRLFRKAIPIFNV